MAKMILHALLAGTLSLGLSLIPVAGADAPRILKTPEPAPGQALVYDYYVGLLRLALVRGAQGRTPPRVVQGGPPEQQPAVEQMILGRQVDITWMGANSERMDKLRVIAIPLDRGLFGYRRLLVRKNSLARFFAVKDLAGLKTLQACQVMGWPDTDIMRRAGLKVQLNPSLDNAYQQLASNHCDYFPRAYIELDTELSQRQKLYPELVVYQGLLLHYPYSLFYFVRKEDEPLARWIEAGLNLMVFKGEISDYMQNHPLTRGYFPLKQAPNIISIANSQLPEGLDTQDARFWLQDIDFQPQK